MCVLSVSPWLQVPKGSISRLHLFERFLIWGLGQPQSAVPSSIIPAEEQRGGEEGAERRKRTGGDGVISYLSLLSPHRRWLPLPPALSHSLTPASPYRSPTLFHHLSCLFFSLLLLLSPAFWTPACSASLTPVRLSIYLSVWLSDLSPDGGPFCVRQQMRMTFYCKTDPYGERWNHQCLN